MSPRTDASINTVSDLFQTNSKGWNSDMIESIFSSWEAAMIKRIHVSEVSNVDVLGCPLTPNGEYLVRSGY